MELAAEELSRAVRAAWTEDLGNGDATTLACVPTTAVTTAVIRAREEAVVCGLQLARMSFQQASPAVKCIAVSSDGETVGRGGELLRVHGPARALLSAERIALNFLQRLSGIATLTSAFVRQLAGTRTHLLDTRKTAPGWRRLEKYAVRCGGGTNHRYRLDDLILIKDNHLVALRGATPNPVAAAVRRARLLYPHLRIEVEADRQEQVEWAVAAGADIILLDNFSLEQLKESVRWIAGRAQTEASGGVRLESVAQIAATGVDFISSGAVTHSAGAVDLGLDFEETEASNCI